MTYYIILMLLYCALSFLEIDGELKIRHRKKYAFFLLFPMMCLVAFRAVTVGNDTYEYLYSYERISNIPTYRLFILHMGRMEFGYTNISYFFSHLGMSFFQFQAILSGFIFYSFWRFIVRYSPYISMSCFLISCGTLYSTMNVMRMELAVAILLFSITYIQKEKWVKFVVIVFVACLFHTSAFVFLVMYPLCVMKYDKTTTKIIVICAIIITTLGASFFQFVTSQIEMYQYYTTSKYFSEDRSLIAVSIGFVETLFTMLLFVFTKYYNKSQYVHTGLNNKDTIVSFDFICKMGYWMVFAFSIISFSNNIMNRLSGYFNILTLIMIPSSILCLKNKESKKFIFFILAFIFMAKQIVIWTYRPGWNLVVPYEWGF